MASELTHNALHDDRVLEYEIIKLDDDFGGFAEALHARRFVI